MFTSSVADADSMLDSDSDTDDYYKMESPNYLSLPTDNEFDSSSYNGGYTPGEGFNDETALPVFGGQTDTPNYYSTQVLSSKAVKPLEFPSKTIYSYRELMELNGFIYSKKMPHWFMRLPHCRFGYRYHPEMNFCMCTKSLFQLHN